MYIIPAKIQETYTIYQINNMQGEAVFIWWCKLIDLYKIKHALANPAFDPNQVYSIIVLTTANSPHAARAAFDKIMNERKGNWPPLNYTVQYNRAGNYICEQTGEVFYHQSDICRRFDVPSSNVSNHIRKVQGYGQIKGYTFRRCDYYDAGREMVHSARVATQGMKHKVRVGKAVKCHQTGAIYRNAAEAADKLGINRGQLSQHLRHAPGYKTVGGMTFERLAISEPQAPAVQYP